tara:strand:+ start:208 stop:438 length:231 start_codon:yes stop_codon:yes gene_type:complete
VISLSAKLVVDSLIVKVIGIAAVVVVPPDAGVLAVVVVIVTVGRVISCVAKKFAELVPAALAKTTTVPSDTPLISA